MAKFDLYLDLLDNEKINYSELEMTEQSVENIMNKTHKKIEEEKCVRHSKTMMKYIPNSRRLKTALIALFIFLSAIALHDNVLAAIKSFFGARIINEEVQEIISSNATSKAETYEIIGEKIVWNSNILGEDGLGDFLIKSVSDIIVDSDGVGYIVPDIAFTNSHMCIFTKKNNEGWYLKKGQSITIEFNVDTSLPNSDAEGEFVIYGYVYNKQFVYMSGKKATSFHVTIVAEEEGTYYPAIVNGAVSYTKIVDGVINE